MTAYQLWKDENGIEYIPACDACGEYLRSSPQYDGGGPMCQRRRCRKERGATVLPECVCSYMHPPHHTGEYCPYTKRAAAAQCMSADGNEQKGKAT